MEVGTDVGIYRKGSYVDIQVLFVYFASLVR